MARLTEDQVQSAAETLIAVREKRLVLAGLPADLTPDSTADMQRIIDATSARISRPTRGWKSYCLYKPMNPPAHAPIYDVFPSGATIPAGISPQRLIEPEIMFRADRDLLPRERRYDVVEVMESVTAVVGFEVIGPRFRMGDPSDRSTPANGQGSLYSSLSDHLANGCIVVGDAVPAWRDIVFEDVPLRVTAGGSELISVVGCHPFDDPVLPVAVAVNRLRRHAGVRAGEIIVTNSSTGFFSIPPGVEVRAVYDGVGRVTATFAED
jgi:2-keto-4-pentenoate hydratase